ncbi:MAG: hypothetical protein UT31_C0001G0010 [Parcubacteria group bacterium GW2011_GWF2_39_13b]|nr:MAG: hypothetical protein UT31_C0001G0010 [Parcubacteria group bacterium GW2011_GWF2_39_13b]
MIKEAGMINNAVNKRGSQQVLFSELELPSWLYLPTDDYDYELVAAQDAVSRMSAEEQKEAMDQITAAFKGRRKIKF